MKLTFLGTGAWSAPSLKRAAASYLLEAGGRTILIDAGPGVVRRILESGHSLDAVDIIVLTHFHPDHTLDLVTFLFACNYGEVRRRKDLVLIGGRGIRTFYNKLGEIYPWIVPHGYGLKLKALSRGEWRSDGFTVATSVVNHRPESIGVRVTEKAKAVVFSGDTDYSPEFVDLTRKANTAVVECSFPERKVEGHLNLADVERIAAETGVVKIFLSHLYPEWDSYHRSLPAPLLLAEDGMVIEI